MLSQNGFLAIVIRCCFHVLPNSDSGAESLFSQDNKYKIGDNIVSTLTVMIHIPLET